MRKFYMLDVDLDTGKAESIDCTELYNEWLGGTGAATRLLLDSCPPETDPFAPEAPVIFAIGPLNNVFPVVTKTVALFKSPLTGNLGESHAGGRLGLAMYESGHHAIRIKGKAKEPSYIVIQNDEVKIKQAYSLKGMSALAAERVLRDREDGLGKRSIVRIGPAGERLSPMACATVDSSRHFGRLGLGAVLGSKNVKAIVISGSRYWNVENKGKYTALYTKIYKEVTESDVMAKYHDLGTAMNILPLNGINGLPTRNFSQGYFEGADRISGEAMAEKHLSQQIACAGCQIGCIHMGTFRESFDDKEHMYKTVKVSYDYELIYSMGTNLSIDSSEKVLKLLQAVEKQGWDVMGMGVTLAWATEAFQRGLITEEQTDGEIFKFGDAETYLRALSKTAAGTNEFYRDLEKGSDFCSGKYGGREFAIAFGKNEAPGYVTGLNAFLGYATGVRHSHLDSAGYSIDEKAENASKPLEERVEALYGEALWRMVFNSLVGCLFARKVYKKDLILEALEAVGIEGWTSEKLDGLAHRIHGMKYKFKLDNGFSLDDLRLPEKLTKVRTTNGKVQNEEFRRGVELYKKYVESDMALIGEI